MLKARWKGFEIDSSENPIPALTANWLTFQHAIAFALFSLPLFGLVGNWLAARATGVAGALATGGHAPPQEPPA